MLGSVFYFGDMFGSVFYFGDVLGSASDVNKPMLFQFGDVNEMQSILVMC